MARHRDRQKSGDGRGHAHGPHRPPRGSIPEAAFAEAASLFRAAGDVARLQLLAQLAEGSWCVSELAQNAGESLSTMSQRLRILRMAGLVSRRRRGKHVFYAIADAHIADVIHNSLVHAQEHAADGRRG